MKKITSLFLALSILSIPSISLAVKPGDFGLKEGDIISATGDPDVYIVNEHGYKRLFVNPQIFNLYGHLGWDKIKKVSPATRDAFVTSGLFRNCESTDGKVFGLDVVNEDVANLRWVNTSGSQAVADDFDFFKKVFCINTKETKLYGSGAQYTSVLQIPKYNRAGNTETTTAGLKIELVAPNKILAGYATNLVIKGSGFKQGAKVDFGTGSILPAYTVTSDTEISILIPATLPALSYSLSITNPDGQIVVLNNALTIQTGSTTPQGLSEAEIFQKVAPSTAFIVTSSGTGSGIIISQDGYILTNQHVVGNYSQVSVYLNDNGYLKEPYKYYSGTVLGKDSVNDLAIIKINGTGLLPISNSSSSESQLPIGSKIYALGFPLSSQIGASSVKILPGIVTGRANGDRYVQVSANIQPGNSGGPLVNSSGQLVGINNLCITESYLCQQGYGFAIAIDYANPFIPGLKSGITTTSTPTPTPTPSATPTPTVIGTLSISKYTGYANQTITVPRTGTKIGHYALTAGSGEDINISTIAFDLDNSGGDFTAADATGTYLKIYNDSSVLIYTSPTKTTLSATANTYAVNFNLSKSKTYQIEVWSDIGSSITSGNWINLNASAIGTSTGSSTSLNTSTATGQKITVQTSVLNKANGSLPAARFVSGGTTVTGYQFTLTPTYDDFVLDEAYVSLSSTDASSVGAVANLVLKNSSGTALATTTVDANTGAASFTGLNLLLTQSNGTQTFTVDVQLSTVGVGANDTGGIVKVRLNGLKYRNSAGSITTENNYDTNVFTGNDNIVVKGYPTFTNQALSTTVLSAGTQTLFKTQVSATGGQVSWNDVTFTVSSVSAAGTFGPNAAGWKLYENGVDITSFATGGVAVVNDVGSTTKVRFTYVTERVVSLSGPIVLELKTTVGGTLAAGDSVTTQIANPKGTVVTVNNATTQQGSGASFVWSDQSSASHSSTTNDWFTDGKVKTLGESQTITK